MGKPWNFRTPAKVSTMIIALLFIPLALIFVVGGETLRTLGVSPAQLVAAMVGFWIFGFGFASLLENSDKF